MYEFIIRDALLKVVSWYAASCYDWQINPGYFGKWLKRFLPTDIWEQYRTTYSGAETNEIWDSALHGPGFNPQNRPGAGRFARLYVSNRR